MPRFLRPRVHFSHPQSPMNIISRSFVVYTSMHELQLVLAADLWHISVFYGPCPFAAKMASKEDTISSHVRSSSRSWAAIHQLPHLSMCTIPDSSWRYWSPQRLCGLPRLSFLLMCPIRPGLFSFGKSRTLRS